MSACVWRITPNLNLIRTNTVAGVRARPSLLQSFEEHTLTNAFVLVVPLFRSHTASIGRTTSNSLFAAFDSRSTN